MPAIKNIPRGSDGQLPAFTWPDGYPMYYITFHAETLCASCATAEYDSGNDTNDNPVVAGEILWEGPPENCAECNKVIESAYGDPDADDAAGSGDSGDGHYCSDCRPARPPRTELDS